MIAVRRNTAAATWIGAAAVGLAAVSADAATIRRANIVIDAKSATPAATVDVTLGADESKPRTAVDLYLVRQTSIAQASLDGKPVQIASADVPKTSLKKWTLTLPVPLTKESSRTVSLRLAFEAGHPGIVASSDRGALLAGSGWFPATSPTADAVVPHTTRFDLPSGARGIACGTSASAEAPWNLTTPGRPFAVWGRYAVSEEKSRSTKIQVWSLPDVKRDARTPDVVASIWERLETRLGGTGGGGDVRLVHGPKGILAGGLNTLVWDESWGGAAPGSPAEYFVRRDVAVALAGSFWTDRTTFAGSHAAWLSRSFAEYLGDIFSVETLDVTRPDDVEAILGGARRDLFFSVRAQDRPLAGLVPASPGANDLLRSRGALVVHMMSETSPSRTMFIRFLEEIGSLDGVSVTREVFFDALQKLIPNQHGYIAPFLDTTNLPDFRISSFEPDQGPNKDRLRVEVENIGQVEASIEVQVLTAAGEPIRTTRMAIQPNQKRATLFTEDGRTATIRLDPRSLTLQSDVSNEIENLEPLTSGGEPLIPLFAFEGPLDDARRLSGFSIALEGVTISGFEGVILPYSTRQGPCGASLLGKGHVRISPAAKHQPSWLDAMGRDALEFEASDLWIRFPLSSWQAIERQLGAPLGEAERSEIVARNEPVFEASFPTHFSDGQRAEIPPPGASLVTFTASSGEQRGFASLPQPDGTRIARFWDQKLGVTMWEDRH
jgi:hypothetical protein